MRVVATPGHTVGHQSVFVETAGGAEVMIGDAAYTADIYTDVEAADLSTWPGQHADRESWTASLEKVHRMRPHAVHFVSDLPRTRNAKILRRVVRSVYTGADPGDLSSLENPSSLAAISATRG